MQTHILRSSQMKGDAKSGGFPIPAIAGWPTGLWLVVGSIFIAFGIWGDVGALMVAAFVIPAAVWFHRFWELEDENAEADANGVLFRNLIALAACLVLFGIFAGLGSNLPFTITDPLFDFWSSS